MQNLAASPVGAVPCAAELQTSKWQSCAAWVDNKNESYHLEPTYSPDMADLIDGPEESAVANDEAISAMAKVMNRVLHFCFENCKNGNPDLSRAFRRFACIVWVLRPELFDHMSLAALAPHLHVTRASLSHIVRKFCDENQIRNVLMKRETVRESYSKAQIASHARRKRRPGVPCKAPGLNDKRCEDHLHSEDCA